MEHTRPFQTNSRPLADTHPDFYSTSTRPSRSRWLEVAIQQATILTGERTGRAQAELQRRGIRRRRVQCRKAIWCRQWLARRILYGQYEQLVQKQSPWDSIDR